MGEELELKTGECGSVFFRRGSVKLIEVCKSNLFLSHQVVSFLDPEDNLNLLLEFGEFLIENLRYVNAERIDKVNLHFVLEFRRLHYVESFHGLLSECSQWLNLFNLHILFASSDCGGFITLINDDIVEFSHPFRDEVDCFESSEFRKL